MSYYDAKQANEYQPTQQQPVTSPTGGMPSSSSAAAAGEPTGVTMPGPAPPTYSQHFASTPPPQQQGYAGSPPPQQGYAGQQPMQYQSQNVQPDGMYVSPQSTGATAGGEAGKGHTDYYSPTAPQHPQPAYQGPGEPKMSSSGYPQNPQQAPTQNQQSQQQQQQFQNVTPIYALQSSPAPVQCPSCGARAITRIELKSGNTTNAWGLGLCLTTCCLCCVPYFVAGTKDVEHRCGQCGVHLATWHRSGRTEVLAHN